MDPAQIVDAQPSTTRLGAASPSCGGGGATRQLVVVRLARKCAAGCRVYEIRNKRPVLYGQKVRCWLLGAKG